ncbi:hypothetical protein D041_3915B, partial [Vibrio parahaemolyticus EKP-008]
VINFKDLGIKHLRFTIVIVIIFLCCYDLKFDAKHFSIKDALQMEEEWQDKNKANTVEHSRNNKHQHNAHVKPCHNKNLLIDRT